MYHVHKMPSVTSGGRRGTVRGKRIIWTPLSAVKDAFQNRTNYIMFVFHSIPHRKCKPLSQKPIKWICLLYGLNGHLNLVPLAIIILHKLLIINFRNIVSKMKKNQFISVELDNWNEDKKTSYLGTVPIKELMLGTHENGRSQPTNVRTLQRQN